LRGCGSAVSVGPEAPAGRKGEGEDPVRHSRSVAIAATFGALILGALVISPALGGPSLKSLVKKEVKKQIAKVKAPVGQQGNPGPPGTAAAPPGGTLPQGVTLRGVFRPSDTHDSTGAIKTPLQGVSFGGYRLSARPDANIVPIGGSATADCPGSLTAPEAAPGQLCVYLSDHSVDLVIIRDPLTLVDGAHYTVATMTPGTAGDGKASTMGFSVGGSGGVSNVASVSGSWAVTS
jgi:hypothetical protein